MSGIMMPLGLMPLEDLVAFGQLCGTSQACAIIYLGFSLYESRRMLVQMGGIMGPSLESAQVRAAKPMRA